MTNFASGAYTFASETLTGIEYPLAKMYWGAAGVSTPVSAANPMPVVIGSTSPVTITGVQDTSTIGTITTAATVVGPLSVVQRNVITVTISGTHAGVTFVIEASDDSGTTWFPLQCINNATGQAGSTWTPGTNAAASYDSAVGGYTNLRVRATAWTSGSAVVRMTGQSFAYDPVVAALAQGLAVANTAIVGAPVRIGGTFTTTLPTYTTGTQTDLQTTARGEVLAALSVAGVLATIKAASTAAAATDPALVVAISPNNGVAITGTGGLAATKASGTAAATTDIAQVVSLSPNSPIVLPTPATSFVNSAATTNATAVKASAGKLYSITASNTGAAVAYVKLYNLAVAPTVGTSTIVLTIPVPAGGTVNIPFGAAGLQFSTGIALSITNLGTDADATAVVAAQVKVASSYI